MDFSAVDFQCRFPYCRVCRSVLAYEQGEHTAQGGNGRAERKPEPEHACNHETCSVHAGKGGYEAR